MHASADQRGALLIEYQQLCGESATICRSEPGYTAATCAALPAAGSASSSRNGFAGPPRRAPARRSPAPESQQRPAALLVDPGKASRPASARRSAWSPGPTGVAISRMTWVTAASISPERPASRPRRRGRFRSRLASCRASARSRSPIWDGSAAAWGGPGPSRTDHKAGPGGGTTVGPATPM